MKITALSFVPPKGTENNPRVTPELCASVLGRFSRSNDGLPKILSKVDLDNPEKSIEAILKFVDYGHASIGGLTGGIAMVLDDVTMWLAFKIFELSPYCDGQESSTRYIKMTEESLPTAESLGFTGTDAVKLDAFGRLALATYHEEYRRLDELANNHPELIRHPANANEKARDRIRKNYALDRARYFLPFYLKTNMAIIQTARAWTDTISALMSLPQKEAQEAGAMLLEQLTPYAPNLVRHARRKSGCVATQADELQKDCAKVRLTHAESEDYIDVNNDGNEGLAKSIAARENRYDRCGRFARETPIQVLFDGMSVAEARDINRHRTGARYFETTHQGFYLPEEVRTGINPETLDRFVVAHSEILNIGAATMVEGVRGALLPYTLVLGSQGIFHRTTTLDKFVYEAELRTGPGAHFRYAAWYRDAVAKLYALLPECDRDCILLGEGEPE